MHGAKQLDAHVQEITRRVNLNNIWQAAYTAGAVLPKPVSTTQYWHRSLNPKKLISVGFSRLQVKTKYPMIPFQKAAPWTPTSAVHPRAPPLDSTPKPHKAFAHSSKKPSV